MKILLLTILLSAGILFGQSLTPSGLFMPVNLRKAYDNGTRSRDGAPGEKYWQNHSAYKIAAEINPASRVVSGKEEIIYHNESPDTLKQIYMRLYQEVYKKGSIRDWPVDPQDLHDGVKIESLKIGGKDYELTGEKSTVRRMVTVMSIQLDEPLIPKSQLQIEVSWEFIIPAISTIRMGAYDSTSFFVAYWYPQLAVYDDIDGWDRFNYGGLQEFYNDMSDYDVQITIPENFIVWATGVLQNPEEVLQFPYLKKYRQALESDEVVRIIAPEDSGKQITKPGKNVWRYTAQGVPDFTLASSDHYLWDAVGLTVGENSERRVRVAAAYKSKSADFYGVAKLARESLQYFSQTMPAWPYPYPEMTVFNGQGGMESPMMVNDGSSNRPAGTVHLTSHEIAHTYFPFFMGINEKKYAWMDEGWAVMLPFDFQSKMAPGYDPIARNAGSFSQYAGRELEIPVITPSIVVGSNTYRESYRNASYNRPAAAYRSLYEMLGDSLFKAALHEYMSLWNHKHPIPYDFFFTFDKVIGERLDWFWKPWFFDRAYPDLGIEDIFMEDGNARVMLRNKGGLPLPVRITTMYEDSSETVVNKAADSWKNQVDRLAVPIDNSKKIIRVMLGSPQIPDVDPADNEYFPHKK